tara:strand:- start:444 stop:845 length:402 start_codon:yes stop_codon:yes gene_type:complete
MDEKTRTFIAQMVFSLTMVAFCVAMIANDSEKNMAIFLPLLTAEVGRWAPGPKLKRKKDPAPDVEQGRGGEAAAIMAAADAQQVKAQVGQQLSAITQLQGVVRGLAAQQQTAAGVGGATTPINMQRQSMPAST